MRNGMTPINHPTGGFHWGQLLGSFHSPYRTKLRGSGFLGAAPGAEEAERADLLCSGRPWASPRVA